MVARAKKVETSLDSRTVARPERVIKHRRVKLRRQVTAWNVRGEELPVGRDPLGVIDVSECADAPQERVVGLCAQHTAGSWERPVHQAGPARGLLLSLEVPGRRGVDVREGPLGIAQVAAHRVIPGVDLVGLVLADVDHKI
ncbi:MAG: hypothetical protein DI635_16925, partial [Pseudoxanthomonas suwonensis]